MPDPREPIVLPFEGNGTCAVCLHAYDEHWIRFDGGLQQCTGLDTDNRPGLRAVCECLEYVPA